MEYVSGWAAYKVSFVDSLRYLEDADKPNEEWNHTGHMISEKDITRIFERFCGELGGSVSGMTKFTPKSDENVVVFFDPAEKRSMHIVATEERDVNDYALKGLKLHKVPFPE